MAIVYDATSSGSDTSGTATSLTFSHTCTGTYRILFVGVTIGSATDRLSGITYAGISMTFVNKQQQNDSSAWLYLYVLVAPATGANNVVITLGSSGGNIGGTSASYTGALQTGQPDSNAIKAVAGASLTITDTVVASSCWLVAVGGCANGPFTFSAPASSRSQGGACIIGDSNAPVGIGSQSLTMTSSLGPIDGVIAAIVPVPMGGGALLAFL